MLQNSNSLNKKKTSLKTKVIASMQSLSQQQFSVELFSTLCNPIYHLMYYVLHKQKTGKNLGESIQL